MIIDTKIFTTHGRDLWEESGVASKFTIWLYIVLRKAKLTPSEYVIYYFKEEKSGCGRSKAQCLFTKEATKRIRKLYSL
ncbi:hypothetical protein VCRA2127O344_20260 [Vibrio crassostreae]|nr:hypothetical protein VCRA2127O344_20260 [Vibrio crassostreae]